MNKWTPLLWKPSEEDVAQLPLGLKLGRKIQKEGKKEKSPQTLASRSILPFSSSLWTVCDTGIPQVSLQTPSPHLNTAPSGDGRAPACPFPRLCLEKGDAAEVEMRWDDRKENVVWPVEEDLGCPWSALNLSAGVHTSCSPTEWWEGRSKELSWKQLPRIANFYKLAHLLGRRKAEQFWWERLLSVWA